MLAPDGELGRIWTLSRPLTYRAIDGLADKGLATRRGQCRGHGRERVALAATAAGRRTATRWLDTPVQHLRDVRTELLVKLTLRERAGLDNTELLAAQQEVFAPAIDGAHLGGRRRRPRRPLAPGERTGGPPVPRPGPPPGRSDG